MLMDRQQKATSQSRSKKGKQEKVPYEDGFAEWPAGHMWSSRPPTLQTGNECISIILGHMILWVGIMFNPRINPAGSVA